MGLNENTQSHKITRKKKERERICATIKYKIYSRGFSFFSLVKVPHTAMVNVNEQENLNEFTFTAHGAFGGNIYLVNSGICKQKYNLQKLILSH